MFVNNHPAPERAPKAARTAGAKRRSSAQDKAGMLCGQPAPYENCGGCIHAMTRWSAHHGCDICSASLPANPSHRQAVRAVFKPGRPAAEPSGRPEYRSAHPRCRPWTAPVNQDVQRSALPVTITLQAL